MVMGLMQLLKIMLSINRVWRGNQLCLVIPTVGQYLELDIQFTDSEALPIRWLWQAKAPDSAIVIKASDLTYEFDNSDGVICFCT